MEFFVDLVIQGGSLRDTRWVEAPTAAAALAATVEEIEALGGSDHEAWLNAGIWEIAVEDGDEVLEGHAVVSFTGTEEQAARWARAARWEWEGRWEREEEVI